LKVINAALGVGWFVNQDPAGTELAGLFSVACLVFGVAVTMKLAKHWTNPSCSLRATRATLSPSTGRTVNGRSWTPKRPGSGAWTITSTTSR